MTDDPGEPSRHPAGGEGSRVSDLEVRQLRSLVALDDSGSMTAAARILGVSQSTVSEAVASLERAVGTAVVARRRGARDTVLTAAGRALLPHARQVLAQLQDARAAVAAAAREARARLELIANESVSTYLLPPALTVLRQRWPGIHFAVSVGTCAAVRDGLARARFDVGILLEAEGAGSAPRRGRGTTDRSLGEVGLALFCGVAHPLAPRTAGAVTRAHVAPYAIYSSDASGDLPALLAAHFQADGIPGPAFQAAGSVEAVKRSVAAHPLALGVLPDYALAEELAAGSVIELRFLPSLPRVRLDALIGGARAHPATADLMAALRARLTQSRATGPAAAGRKKRAR